MIIEGLNPVSEAFAGGLTVEKLLVQKGIVSEKLNKIVAVAKENRVNLVFAERDLLDKKSPSGRHQGVIAYVTEFQYADLEDILGETDHPKLILILDGIEDPHNFGAIIRTAECSGADGIIIGKHRAVTVNDTVMKVSSGAAAHVPIVKVTNINDAVRLLKDRFVKVYAADAEGVSLYGEDLRGDAAVIIGGEGKGVSALTRKLADTVVSLPQSGKVNSLNASVAAGIFLYEAVRQRVKR